MKKGPLLLFALCRAMNQVLAQLGVFAGLASGWALGVKYGCEGLTNNTRFFGFLYFIATIISGFGRKLRAVRPFQLPFTNRRAATERRCCWHDVAPISRQDGVPTPSSKMTSLVCYLSSFPTWKGFLLHLPFPTCAA